MRVYLAGAMGGRMGEDVIRERFVATSLLEDADIEVYDPAANENVDPHKIIDLKLDYITMKSYVAKDEYAISRSDVLLILTGDKASEGTLLEFGYAKGAFHSGLNLPVIVVSGKRATEGMMGFVNVKCDAIFATIEEAVEFIAANYQ